MSASKSTEGATGAAITEARRLVADARLSDPGEHFPYKRAVVDGLITKDAPMGPEGPKDTSVTAQDFTSPRIAEATEQYVKAQEAWLKNGTRANHELYEAAKEELLSARRAHRRSRVDSDGNPVAGVVGVTSAAAPEHLRGPRLRRVGEE